MLRCPRARAVRPIGCPITLSVGGFLSHPIAAGSTRPTQLTTVPVQQISSLDVNYWIFLCQSSSPRKAYSFAPYMVSLPTIKSALGFVANLHSNRTSCRLRPKNRKGCPLSSICGSSLTPLLGELGTKHASYRETAVVSPRGRSKPGTCPTLCSS